MKKWRNNGDDVQKKETLYPSLVGQSGSPVLLRGLESTLESESSQTTLSDFCPCETLGMAGLPKTRAGEDNNYWFR